MNKTLTIDGVTYAPVDPNLTSDVRIVILQRGWVMVGRYTRDGDRCSLDNAQVIRKWGTTKGLGELVNGPLPSTVLDPAGHVEFHALGEIASLAASAEGWGL
jgi:hypothetical protein